MSVLVINSGSSSIKFRLYDSHTEEELASGAVFRIGEGGSYLEYCRHGDNHICDVETPDHAAALDRVVQVLLDKKQGALASLAEIEAVGHRVVHGGSVITESVLVDDAAIGVIEDHNWLAPLHNPFNLMGILECRRLLPDAPQVAVFDTSFHQTLPPRAYRYTLPDYYERYGVRRYGFHGISFRYVSQRAAEILGTNLEALRMVACHLGNGVSVTAIKNGRSVDTSMGMSPLEGLIMGTRCGDTDPGVVLFMMSGPPNLSPQEATDVLYHESGLLGLSGVSKDVRDVVERAGEGDERCQLAIETYAYRIKKYVAAYAGAMGGIDVLVFTAGVGENSAEVRAAVCDGLGFLGIELDCQINEATHGSAGSIGLSTAETPVLVVPTNEEIVILRDTLVLTGGAGIGSARPE